MRHALPPADVIAKGKQECDERRHGEAAGAIGRCVGSACMARQRGARLLLERLDQVEVVVCDIVVVILDFGERLLVPARTVIGA